MLGDGGGPPGGMHTHQWRAVCRGGDHHGTLHALRAQGLLDKLTDLTPTLADHGNDHDLGIGVPGHHAQQRAFADTGAGEQADALATAHG